MRHYVGAAQLPTADAVAESAECGMVNPAMTGLKKVQNGTEAVTLHYMLT